MPVFLRTRGYKVYFWSNERDEPIHFHLTKGDPSEEDTKIWVMKDGTMKLAHNKSRIPERDIMRIMILMQSYIPEYEQVWKTFMGSVSYYR